MGRFAQSRLRKEVMLLQNRGRYFMQYPMKLLVAGALALSAGSFSTGAQAAQVCFQLNPFSDTLRLEFAPLTDGHRNVYGNWVVSGVYTLPVSGAYELDVGSTTVRRLGIVGTNSNAADFGGNL